MNKMVASKAFFGLIAAFMLLTADRLMTQEAFIPLPRQYRGIELGMSTDQVKEKLSEDGWFNYHGEEDVSLLERPRASLIETEGSLFFSRGLFQFENNALAAIILELDPNTIDWYTVFTSMQDKYGTPKEAAPDRMWWEDGKTRLAMERPFTVKYLDMEVFDAMLAEETDRTAWREAARIKFINEF